jgi:catechol 2,3-dioxygenase-like lactoylglutathione lyase family enzyme
VTGGCHNCAGPSVYSDVTNDLMYRERLMTANKLEAARGRPPAAADNRRSAAQAFYRDVLGGRQLTRTERDSRAGSLWFFVAGRLVEVCPAQASTAEALELSVESPAEIAERCWDSGHTVRVPADASSGAMIVVDPFGRPITLLPSAAEHSLGAEAAG